ncbi:PAS domain S-box protein [Clostridium sp. NSJ-145]|uniref:sensor histidine kinase n=1 Tax=Clostridium sp. NSJ-145 TaxID=2897777 RepID=UPI001E56A0B9|nr:PAS domain S-box protein [Clostridium sp. NSJ-145]MCD2500949.1 PAS domain S-box protein [Clostridium sp. NSJ-145]
MKYFLNNLQDKIIIIDTNGRILFINNSFIKFIPISLDNLRGLKIDHLIKDKSDVDKILKGKNGESIVYISTNNINKKCNITYSYSKFNTTDAIFINLSEVENHSYTKEHLESILDNSNFMAWIKDKNGKYIYMNKLFAKALNANINEYIGTSPVDYFNKESVKRIQATENVIINSKEAKVFDHTYILKSGKEIVLSRCVYPILDNNKEVTYIIGLSKDITLTNFIESSLNKSYDQLTILQRLLDQGTNTANDFTVINKIKWNIINTLGCSEFNFFIHYNEYLVPYYCNNNFNSSHCADSYIPIEKDNFQSILDNYNDYCMLPIEKHNDFIKNLYKDKFKYIGVYPIKFNNDILGILHVCYKNKVDFPSKNYSFSATFAKQLGAIINNCLLTEKLKAEFNKRLEIEEELSFLLNTAVDITATISKDGKHKKISNSYTKVLGWTVDELNSGHWRDLIHPDDINNILNIYKYNLSKNYDSCNIICRMLSKNGEYRWLSWNCRSFKEDSIYLCTAKDITEEKKLESENKIIEEALQLENIKNEFFANISHEFKTPLNIILASLQIINKNIDSNNILVHNNFNLNNYLNSIKQNSYRLLRLANNIIDMTKIDTGYYEIHPKNHNIISVIEDITMSVVQYIEDKGIEIIFDTDVEEKIISCDSEKVERIMLNLLSNAVKYVGKDGKIEVKITTLSNDILVSVKDNGVGISEDKIDLIFERFMQVDNTMTRKCEGSGIGLSIVESLVKLHGGNITVTSSKEKGTEFLFTLPIKVIENEPIIDNFNSNCMNTIEKCNIEFSDI